MEKVIISTEGSYILLKNIAEFKHSSGDSLHTFEVRIIGDRDFIPVSVKLTELINKHFEVI